VAWRRAQPDPFPAPLREFHEEEWPPVEGECLEIYACRADGYGVPCAPRPGEPCGQACYAHLAAEYPDRPEVLAAAKSSDAYQRFHLARLTWLGKDHPDYLDEFIDAYGLFGKIRYAPFRNG
jgi:hypothetical protein